MRTIIIIPTYNESPNLPVLVPRLAAAAPEAHLMLVDDDSPDATADRAEALFKSNPAYANYTVLRRKGPRGLGLAYRDGFARALELGFERMVQMDADLSHDPEDVPKLLAASSRADLVIGSRYVHNGAVRDWSAHRVLLSRFAGWYVRQVLGTPFKDPTAGFRCWTRAGLEAVKIETLHSEGYAFQVEMILRAYRARLKIEEVPITFSDRTHGKSKMSRGVLFESMILPWKLKFQARGFKA